MEAVEEFLKNLADGLIFGLRVSFLVVGWSDCVFMQRTFRVVIGHQIRGKASQDLLFLSFLGRIFSSNLYLLLVLLAKNL